MSRTGRGAFALTACGLLLVLVGSCSSRSGGLPPFDYREVIDRVAASSSAARVPELRRCVASWKPWESTRRKLFAALEKQQAPGSPDAVLLEVGNPTWPLYGFAVAEAGSVVPSIADAQPSTWRGRIPPVAVESLRDVVDVRVDGGLCWFVSLMHDGKVAQVVQYGTLKDTAGIAEVVRQMTAQLMEPPLPSAN